ncbi:MauE/DoxX family redox-associated membrane protein [Mucilaginibacter sp. OAE612]|uniref:MauE/DoxX family redox-associated membrane protein n=1 Tax=Mucilaginibacter sp. OAE612 TaxID=3156444 RepID=UPI00359F2133
MKTTIQSLLISLLIMLFIYAALSKLLTFSDFRQQLYNQNFSHGFAAFLTYFLPGAEIITAGFLCFKRTVLAGLFLSAILLVAFTGYISLVMLHYWDRMPCSCGGILSHMSWTAHLIFNWFFLILNLIAIYLQLPERKQQPLLTD